MLRIANQIARRLPRVFSLVLLAALGSAVLMRYSPGYFTDAREIDAAHADAARLQVSALQSEQGSLPALLLAQLRSWASGNLGQSRHFGVPVRDLLRERSGTSARLLFRGIGTGWLAALALALPLSARRTRRGEFALAGSTAVLLAVPVGVLATASLLLNAGGPASVLALLIVVRDFKLLYSLLRSSWDAPHILQARAQGLSFQRTAWVHLVPVLRREFLAMAMMSLVIALSSLVPVEVIFDVSGLGQLAWSAAMNRDLPVLAAVTALLAACVGVAGMFASPDRSAEVAQCA